MYFNSFFCIFFNPVLVFFPGVHKYLLITCYIPATVLGSGATKLNKTDIPAFTELMWSLSVLLALLLSLTGLTMKALLLLLLSRFSRVRLCATPQTAAHCWPCCHITMGLSSRGAVLPSPAVTMFTLSERSIHRGFSASPLDISYIQLNLCITSVPTLAIQIVRMWFHKTHWQDTV